MKKTEIYIKKCEHCPFRFINFCELVGQDIDVEEGKIPEWCPLEDAE